MASAPPEDNTTASSAQPQDVAAPLQDTNNFDTLNQSVADLEATLGVIRREQKGLYVANTEKLCNDLQLLRATVSSETEQKEAEYGEKYSLFQRMCSCFCCVADEVSSFYDTEISPKKQRIHQIGALQTKAVQLDKTVKQWAFEKRTEWNGGIAVVYNPNTGRAEWRKKWHHGVHGVYNPVTQQVEWKDLWNGDVFGVFNPVTQQVEWKQEWHHGVAGVFNPVTQQVEWKTSWNHGIAGVWNPITQQVEWKDNWNGGVCGYFDDNEKVVKWFEQWHHGIAVIAYNPNSNAFITTKGCCWDWSK